MSTSSFRVHQPSFEEDLHSASPVKAFPTTAVNRPVDLSGKLLIKARFGDDIRRILIPACESMLYAELVIMLQRTFDGPKESLASRGNEDDFIIKYKDEDGDLVTVHNDTDLEVALFFSKPRLDLTIFPCGEQLAEEAEKEMKSENEARILDDSFNHQFDPLTKSNDQFENSPAPQPITQPPPQHQMQEQAQQPSFPQTQQPPSFPSNEYQFHGQYAPQPQQQQEMQFPSAPAQPTQFSPQQPSNYFAPAPPIAQQLHQQQQQPQQPQPPFFNPGVAFPSPSPQQMQPLRPPSFMRPSVKQWNQDFMPRN